MFLGYLAVVVELISYGVYFYGIYKGKTKPHAFTWLVWSVLNLVAFFAVLVSGGDSVAWILGINAIACLAIAIIGFRQRHVVYDTYDWLALGGAFLGVFLWWLTSNPLYAIISVCISELLGIIPTFRKAYRLPFEENMSAFTIGLFYYFLALLALDSFLLTNWLYPAFIIVLDGAVVVLIFIRRRNKVI